MRIRVVRYFVLVSLDCSDSSSTYLCTPPLNYTMTTCIPSITSHFCATKGQSKLPLRMTCAWWRVTTKCMCITCASPAASCKGSCRHTSAVPDQPHIYIGQCPRGPTCEEFVSFPLYRTSLKRYSICAKPEMGGTKNELCEETDQFSAHAIKQKRNETKNQCNECKRAIKAIWYCEKCPKIWCKACYGNLVCKKFHIVGMPLTDS